MTYYHIAAGYCAGYCTQGYWQVLCVCTFAYLYVFTVIVSKVNFNGYIGYSANIFEGWVLRNHVNWDIDVLSKFGELCNLCTLQQNIKVWFLKYVQYMMTYVNTATIALQRLLKQNKNYELTLQMNWLHHTMSYRCGFHIIWY